MARGGFPAPWCILPWILIGGFPAEPAVAAGASSKDLERVASLHFDPAFRREARDYRRPRTAVYVAELVVTVGVSVWILIGAGSGWFRGLVPAGLPGWAARLVLLTAAYIGLAVLRFPFRVFFYLHAREAGLRHDPWGGFLLDWSKALGIGWIQVVFAGLLLLGLLSAAPRWGWVLGSAGIALIAVAYVTVAPLVIDPLFHRFRPLVDPSLESRLLDVARRGGIEVKEILVADASRRTRAVNAYFTGLGRTKRIVLYDTLVEKFPPDEAAVVMAHEIGHWKHRHVVWGLTGGLLAASFGLWILFTFLHRGAASGAWGATGRGDPILALPLYAGVLVLLTAALVPSNVISRRMETQADLASLALTGDREAFVRGEVRMARENLSDVAPPAWVEFLFFSHPATARRILLAEPEK